MRKCGNKADFRYTWPGRCEEGACTEHSVGLIAIANALGFFLQLIPVSENEDRTCGQYVKDSEETK